MANLGEILRAHGSLSAIEVEWLHLLVVDWQVVSDLSFADLVLWIDDREGGFISAAHCRPSTGVTVHHDDIVGHRLPHGRVEGMRRAFDQKQIQHSADPRWTGSFAVREDLVPVVCNGRAIAVISREANLGIARSPSLLEVNYMALGDDLCAMVARGEFPQTSAPGSRRGGPRVVDGVVRLDAHGIVNYASPNAISCFHRMGLPDALTGKVLAWGGNGKGQTTVPAAALTRVSEVAADDIPPTSHPVPLVNVTRPDEARPSLARADALAAAPAVEDDRFRVPRILEEEE